MSFRSEDVTPRVIEDSASARQAAKLGENCRQFGIKAFYGPNDPHQGIEHVLMDEQGLVRPGMVVICGDSHTTTHGSLGALAFGIGTSEIEHILATQTLVYRMAKTMLIRIGRTSPGRGNRERSGACGAEEDLRPRRSGLCG